MKRSKLIIVITVVILGAICSIFIWHGKNKNDEIKHALAIPSLPCEITIVNFEHEDFFEKKLITEFEFKREFVKDMLVGREWKRIEKTDEIISMKEAIDGYTWTQGRKYAEVVFFDRGKNVMCRLFYSVE